MECEEVGQLGEVEGRVEGKASIVGGLLDKGESGVAQGEHCANSFDLESD